MSCSPGCTCSMWQLGLLCCLCGVIVHYVQALLCLPLPAASYLSPATRVYKYPPLCRVASCQKITLKFQLVQQGMHFLASTCPQSSSLQNDEEDDH